MSRQPPASTRRSGRLVSERGITALAILLAAMYVALAALPVASNTGLGIWLPPHLLLAARHSIDTLRRRAAWSSDRGWHRFTTWSLVAGVVWFTVGTVGAAAAVVLTSTAGADWQFGPFAVPIGAGWAAQVLVGSWSHLIPAVGPGSPSRHAAQRVALGQLAGVRLAVVNTAVVALSVGQITGWRVVSTAGALGVVAYGVACVGLLIAALAVRR